MSHLDTFKRQCSGFSSEYFVVNFKKMLLSVVYQTISNGPVRFDSMQSQKASSCEFILGLNYTQ